MYFNLNFANQPKTQLCPKCHMFDFRLISPDHITSHLYYLLNQFSLSLQIHKLFMIQLMIFMTFALCSFFKDKCFLMHYPRSSHLAAIFGQMSQNRKFYIPPAVEVVYFVVCLENIVNASTTLKLIQKRAEENQIWQKIQNPITSPRQHMVEPMEVLLMM